MSDIRDEVRAEFLDVFGYEPAGVWSAPGSLSLGDGLSFAINRRTVLALGVHDEPTVRLATDAQIFESPLNDLADAAIFAAVRALGENGADLAAVPGIDILFDSTIPEGAGLGGATALDAALLIALNDVWQLGLGRRELVQVVPGASAALLGKPDTAIDFGTLALEPLGFADAGTEVLVIDTGDETGVDLALETAEENGAIGGAWIGDGYVCVLLPEGGVSRVQVAIDGAFAEHGQGQPVTFTVVASGGAVRES